jgi:hypothetical protein
VRVRIPLASLDFESTARFRDRAHNCFGYIGLKKYYSEVLAGVA